MSDAFKGTKLMFCDILGEPELHFAWWPVRCFDGKIVWLRPVWARLCLRKPHLAGPDDPFWQYARAKEAQEKRK